MIRQGAMAIAACGVLLFGAVARGDDQLGPVDPGGGKGIFTGPESVGSVDATTGTATFDYAFEGGPSRGGVRAPLVLHYNHNAGQGEAGQGFSLSVPFIEVTRGDWQGGVGPFAQYPFPRATFSENRYTFGGQALVRVCLVDQAQCAAAPNESFPGIPQGATYFRLQREGAFLRFFQVNNIDGGMWIVQHKDGMVEEYGAIPAGTLPGSEQVMFDTEGGQLPEAVRWYLTRRYDQHRSGGVPLNVAVYRWKALGVRGLHYLTDVYDTPKRGETASFTTYANHTRLIYEYPDFPVWRGITPQHAEPEMRLRRIDMTTHEWVPKPNRQLLRRYWFSYLRQPFHGAGDNGFYNPNVHAPVRGRSFLESIQVEAGCGVQESTGLDPDEVVPDVTSCKRLFPTTFTYNGRRQPSMGFGLPRAPSSGHVGQHSEFCRSAT